MMQAVLGGKPVVTIPFQPDQLIHAYRFQELGLGRCTVNISPKMIKNLLKGDWEGILQAGSDTSNKKIEKEASKVLREKEKYSKKINEFCKNLSYEDSAKKAAGFIQDWE